MPKQLLAVGGRPILERSVDAFLAHPAVDEIVVALPRRARRPIRPPYLRGRVRSRCASSPAARAGRIRWRTRFARVARRATIVVIHDAARPFATRGSDRPHDRGRRRRTAPRSPRCRRSDTVKRVGRGDGAPSSPRRIPRETIFLAQTPQAFRRDVLRGGAGARASRRRGDRRGGARRARRPRACTSSRASRRTSRSRRRRIWRSPTRSRAAGEPARTGRAGTGYDLHRLVDGPAAGSRRRRRFRSTRGALGHSDADVVCHAVTDAILGAAGARRHRPALSRHRSPLEGARRASTCCGARRVVGRGARLRGRQRRRHRDRSKRRSFGAARRRDARSRSRPSLGIDADRVSVKGKTNEGVDAIGRGEAIAAHAVALLRSRT